MRIIDKAALFLSHSESYNELNKRLQNKEHGKTNREQYFLCVYLNKEEFNVGDFHIKLPTTSGEL